MEFKLNEEQLLAIIGAILWHGDKVAGDEAIQVSGYAGDAVNHLHWLREIMAEYREADPAPGELEGEDDEEDETWCSSCGSHIRPEYGSNEQLKYDSNEQLKYDPPKQHPLNCYCDDCWGICEEWAKP